MFEQIGNFGKVIEGLAKISDNIGGAFDNIVTLANPINWIIFADDFASNVFDATSSALLSSY
ncbi:hypothetical protein HW450_09355 [Corynebacterium hindlerae]|uniref:Uncharacterized protein n=1 Tax=Corynebacterium hindlerae TaxID=699041 RepID=A0A7G5FD73_9CORY|nr:hypothetical protein [Corynebacterium hindlerae]QMV84564.1 hypothetical protein HW450_09355 [Corynebacterium hindlerae]